MKFTPLQKSLRKKHGTPAEFAVAVYQCVPSDISMDEARAAVDKYAQEWTTAGHPSMADKTVQKVQRILSQNSVDSKRHARKRRLRQSPPTASGAYVRARGTAATRINS